MRRPLRLTAALALMASSVGCVVLGTVPAAAEDTVVPGTMSTTAVNTTRFDLPVPPGVVPRAITGARANGFALWRGLRYGRQLPEHRYGICGRSFGAVRPLSLNREVRGRSGFAAFAFRDPTSNRVSEQWQRR